nr:retrotransposon protein, putative, Ty1-copia subclass [Tanacetum cinerariifolium]
MFLSHKTYAIVVFKHADMLNCNPFWTQVDMDSKLSADDFSYSHLSPHLWWHTRMLTELVALRLTCLLLAIVFFLATISSFGSASDSSRFHGPVRRLNIGVCQFGCRDMLDAQYFLCELHSLLSSATIVYCNNVSGVYLSSKPVQHHRTKHIEIDIHFIRDLVTTAHVRVLHVPLIIVSKNNVFYFNDIPSNGIYEIDMHDLDVNSIYIISTKRAKHNLDSTYLWHCRLAHISKKCIEKLQQEGVLKSTDDESFDQCVSCLSGKITRKLFPHRPERATDLFGIIHTDVCGPLRHVSRQGASYFITFIDDYSRYSYVYLLKHKHEVFEMFKVFKNEVENQLKKTIKAPRSDRGYPKETMSYYFYFQPKNKIGVARYVEFFEKNFITQEVSGRAVDLEEIQNEDASPSEITSKIPMEVKGFEPPQEEVILIRRNTIHDRQYGMGLGLDLPPGYKTIGSK